MNLLTKTENQAPARRVIAPRYDVRETTDAFTVTAFLPGVDRTSLETQVDGEKLTISGRRAWTPPTDWTPVYRETNDTDYRLVIEVDHRVNREAVRAELNQGVLTLTLPKAESARVA